MLVVARRSRCETVCDLVCALQLHRVYCFVAVRQLMESVFLCVKYSPIQHFLIPELVPRDLTCE